MRSRLTLAGGSSARGTSVGAASFSTAASTEDGTMGGACLTVFLPLVEAPVDPGGPASAAGPDGPASAVSSGAATTSTTSETATTSRSQETTSRSQEPT